MTTARLTKSGTIHGRNPVREAFAGCSTGNDGGCYYETKGHGIRAYSDALAAHGLQFNPNDCIGMVGGDGRLILEICTDDDDCQVVGTALITWYRMEQSGRYEFVGYIA